MPTQQNAFPISLTTADYKNELAKRHRLQGVSPSACAVIDELQPLNLPEAEREQSPLALLDKLTNINKHRRVLLTNLKREVLEDQPLPFPHILTDMKGILPSGIRHNLVTFAFYVAIEERIVSGKEIGTVLDVFGNFILKELLPLFQKFFEIP